MTGTALIERESEAATAVALSAPSLPAMSQESIDKVKMVETLSLEFLKQVDLPTGNLIHGGMYARTLFMPAGTVLTGALLKVPTVLIVSGDCAVFIGEETIELRGYTVLPGSAGRKQIFYAHTDLNMTMLFPTDATTVDRCEREFTDEYELLMTNRMTSVTTLITGE